MRPQKTITLFICTSQIALALKAIADPKGLFHNRRVAGTHAELGDEIPGFAPLAIRPHWPIRLLFQVSGRLL